MDSGADLTAFRGLGAAPLRSRHCQHRRRAGPGRAARMEAARRGLGPTGGEARGFPAHPQRPIGGGPGGGRHGAATGAPGRKCPTKAMGNLIACACARTHARRPSVPPSVDRGRRPRPNSGPGRGGRSAATASSSRRAREIEFPGDGPSTVARRLRSRRFQSVAKSDLTSWLSTA